MNSILGGNDETENQKGKSVYFEKTLHRTKVLALVIRKEITQSQAAKRLRLGPNRQIRNLLRKYISGNHSISSLIHTRSGETWNKIDIVIRNKVEGIKKMHPNLANPHIANVVERELKEKRVLVKLDEITARNILLELPDYRSAVVRFKPAKEFETDSASRTCSTRYLIFQKRTSLLRQKDYLLHSLPG